MQMRLSDHFTLCLMPAVLLFSMPLMAHPQTVPMPLSDQAEKVLSRLDTISTGLPDGEWRSHNGDLPHGEDPTLDDSSWTLRKGRYSVPPDAIWLRRTVVLPETLGGYSFRGARLYLGLKARSDGGEQEIIYLDGRRIAMGEDLEPQVLTEHAEPGQTFHLAIKLLHSADTKRISPATYLFEFPSNRPNPADFRSEVLSAVALLPTITSDKVALAQQSEMLDRALTSIDVTALDMQDQAKFDASLRKAQSLIEPLRETLRPLNISLIGNSHIDTEWLWPISETVDVVRRTFSTALQLMAEYPNYKYTQSAALYDAWLEEKYPGVFQDIRKRQEEGRWEIVGGMWVEPDLNMPDGESQVRQLLIGKNYFKKQMGVDVNIGWNPDSFGYNWQLPQIYKKSGIDYFVTQKMQWNETNKLPLKLFWWQSPDGSRVLTFFPDDYVKDPEPTLLANDFAFERRVDPGADSMLHLFGVGDHGGGPTRVVLEQAQHMMDSYPVYPKTAFSTAKEFFANVASRVQAAPGVPPWNYSLWAKGIADLPSAPDGKINVPVWNDELYLETHRGTYTSQAFQKKNMRESEEEMVNAEKAASIAWLGGEAYPKDVLNEQWKKVLVGQFHDSAAGSAVRAVYADNERDYEVVRQTTDAITHSALSEITAHINTQMPDGAVPLVIFNPLAWIRSDLVEADVQLPRPIKRGIEVIAADGHSVLSQVLHEDKATGRYHLLLRVENVPSMGYLVLQVRDGKSSAKSTISVSSTGLENALLKLVVDPATGCITHLIEKSSGFDSILAGGCGNELQTFSDNPKSYDAWNIDADALTKMSPIHAVDSVQVDEAGPLRAKLRIERHWGKSKFVQYLQMYADTPRVDVVNDFDWQETHVLLKAAFPLAASSSQATYEIPFGSIQRPTTRSSAIERAKFEVPALRWADLGDTHHGFSLMNTSKYGYDAEVNTLRLSLLRSPAYPEPDTDKGRQQFMYSLYPHEGTWQHAMTFRRAYELNYRLLATQAEAHNGVLPPSHSFLALTSDNVVLTAMKKAEEGNSLILRLFEWQGSTSVVHIELPGHPTAAQESGMMETDIIAPQKLEGSIIQTTFKPYEIKTLRIDYGDLGASFWQTIAH
jgi:alpha-mannosidase